MKNIAETAVIGDLVYLVIAALQHKFGVPHPYLLDVSNSKFD